MSDRRLVASRRASQALSSIRRFFDTGNLVRFMMSMVLAFGLWAWVTYQNDPETTRVLGGITVTLENLEESFEIVGESPTVDITLQGPQSVVTPLERENVAASVDMSDIDQTGAHELDVTVDVPSETRIRDIVPESVVIEIDQMSSRDDIPVSLQEPGDVPANYQVQSVDVDPQQISVSGPDRTLHAIDRAEVQVEIDERTSSFTDSIEPVLVDESGEQLTGLTMDPAEITVTVTLDVRGQVRKIIPVVVGDDALAPGHELVRTTVLPTDDVVVDGPEEALADVFFVTTEPVDITDWDQSQIVRNVELDRSRLPDSVTIEGETVHVSIEIRRQIHEREVSDIPISVMNVVEDTEITLGKETGSVVLEGSRTAVESIDPDDITLFINVANADPGEYEFELRVIVPAQVQYREVNPDFVTVEIESADDS